MPADKTKQNNDENKKKTSTHKTKNEMKVSLCIWDSCRGRVHEDGLLLIGRRLPPPCASPRCCIAGQDRRGGRGRAQLQFVPLIMSTGEEWALSCGRENMPGARSCAISCTRQRNELSLYEAPVARTRMGIDIFNFSRSQTSTTTFIVL